MPIEVRCPRCRTALEVPEQWQGKKDSSAGGDALRRAGPVAQACQYPCAGARGSAR